MTKTEADLPLVSSQEYRDEEIVEAKRTAGDYTVSVVTIEAL